MIQHKLFYQDPVQTPVLLHHVSDTPILEKDILRTWLNVKPGTLIKDLKGNSILSTKEKDGATCIKLKLIGWEGIFNQW